MIAISSSSSSSIVLRSRVALVQQRPRNSNNNKKKKDRICPCAKATDADADIDNSLLRKIFSTVYAKKGNERRRIKYGVFTEKVRADDGSDGDKDVLRARAEADLVVIDWDERERRGLFLLSTLRRARRSD
jgi:hypothetical protein